MNKVQGVDSTKQGKTILSIDHRIEKCFNPELLYIISQSYCTADPAEVQ